MKNSSSFSFISKERNSTITQAKKLVSLITPCKVTNSFLSYIYIYIQVLHGKNAWEHQCIKTEFKLATRHSLLNCYS